MKSIVTKLLAVVFIFALATGCASTLAGPAQSSQAKITKKKPNNVKGGTDYNTHVNKPDG
jgi:hypothetical protein